MAQLAKDVEREKEIIYRKGDMRSEAKNYSFKYIPHMIIADKNGRQLAAIEARELIAAFKNGRFSATVISKAKRYI